MAEKDAAEPGLLNLNNPDMRTSYANFSHVHVNMTDIYLYFGMQSPDGGVENVRVDTRIVLTHDTFIKMMEFWSTRYSALMSIYGDNPRSLNDYDRAKISQAFAEYLGQPEPGNEQEHSDE